jgi:DNA-binding MarR family transcriptional regulator
MRHHADAKGGQGRILGFLLRRERIPQREMQELLGVQAGSLSEILSKLEAGGLISRTPNEDDRRSMDIVMTEEGGRIAQESEVHRQQRRETLFQALSEEEKRTLAALLEKLNEDWSSRFEKGPGRCGHGHEGHGNHENHGCHGNHENHGNEGCPGNHGHHGPHGGHGHHGPQSEEAQP